MNITINGNKTKNQAMLVAPALHIRFKIHVQNTTYNIFITKIKDVFGTSHDCEPKQYTLVLPKFCVIATNKKTIDIIK